VTSVYAAGLAAAAAFFGELFRFFPPFAFLGERAFFGLCTAPAFFARGAFAFDPAALRAAIA